MILVDSSVWIDYFKGTGTKQTDLLDRLLSSEPLAIGDLNLTEVLQGFSKDDDFETAKQMLTSLTVVQLCSPSLAIQAAEHFRALRRYGLTVRKTIDVIIATRCIADGYELLHNDRDFDGFEQRLGLKSALTGRSNG